MIWALLATTFDMLPTSLSAKLPMLCWLARKHGTDKVTHGYTKVYHRLLKTRRTERIALLEIGIFGGASIRMWREYFKSGNIFGIDNCKLNPEICDEIMCPPGVLKTLNELDRVQVYSFDQNNRDDLKEFISLTPQLDIIVDDGLHHQSHQQVSLGTLFPNLKSGGIYFIEDIATLWGLQTGAWWGQKDGIENTERGESLWFQTYLKTGKLRDKSHFGDCTDVVLNNYIRNGIFQSPYLTQDENAYLQENIAQIDMIYPRIQKKDEEFHQKYGIPHGPASTSSPLKTGCLAIIKKK